MAGKRKRLNAFGSSSPVRHIRLYHWMLNSAAWSALSMTARCLLLEVWKRHNGLNNGEISYSVREAARDLRISKNTAHSAFRELEDMGFLVAVQRGSFDWKSGKATTWRLTMERCRDEPATKEFMSWKPQLAKRKPVPPRGTDGPTERDRGMRKPYQNGPISPPDRDRQAAR